MTQGLILDGTPESVKSRDISSRRQFLWSLGGVVTFTLLNLAVATGALYFSWASYELARGAAEAQQFTQLRERLYEVQDQLPPDANLLDSGPNRGTKEWTAFRAYWEQAYTEWHVTTKISDGQFRRLWNGFYEPVFRSVIKRPAFRDTAADLLNEEFAHGPRIEFAMLLQTFHLEETGRELTRDIVVKP